VTSLQDCLIANNVNAATIENAGAAGNLQIDGCTLAGNEILGSSGFVIQNSGAVQVALTNSIIALNAYTGASGAVTSAHGFIFAADIIAAETASLLSASSSNVNSLDPAFVNPAQGDYHLRSDSPAIDYHRNQVFALPAAGLDLDGRPRGVPLLSSKSSAFDIGAYELQVIAPCGEADKIFCNDFGTP
jgi:hypothetical protein